MDRKHIVAIILWGMVVAAACAHLAWFPGAPLRGAAGLGPNWDCVPQIKGDAVCFKKPGH